MATATVKSYETPARTAAEKPLFPARERHMSVHFTGNAGDAFGIGLADGITFVADAVGRHGCMNMHGGRAVVLSVPGEEFCQGMCGGVVYAHDPDGILGGDAFDGGQQAERLIPGSEEERELKTLIQEHLTMTRSELAKALLENWKDERRNFLKITAKNGMQRQIM